MREMVMAVMKKTMRCSNRTLMLDEILADQLASLRIYLHLILVFVLWEMTLV